MKKLTEEKDKMIDKLEKDYNNASNDTRGKSLKLMKDAYTFQGRSGRFYEFDLYRQSGENCVEYPNPPLREQVVDIPMTFDTDLRPQDKAIYQAWRDEIEAALGDVTDKIEALHGVDLGDWSSNTYAEKDINEERNLCSQGNEAVIRVIDKNGNQSVRLIRP